MSKLLPPGVGSVIGRRVLVLSVLMFLVTGLVPVLPGVAPSATAAIPTPAADQAVITVKVGGDRLPNGTVQGLPGVRLGLFGAGTASTAPNALSAVQGSSGTRHDASWSWTTCVSDADGDCSFVIPIRAGAISATGVPQDTRFWVAQDTAAGSVPAGWYSNPRARVGGNGATPDFTWGYRFRTDTQLRAGQTYRSTAPMTATAALTDPDLGFLRNREDTNAEGGQGANVGRSTGIWNQSRTNPVLAADCGLDIAIVTDTSGSLGDDGMAEAKATMNAFVDGFRGTPTAMAVFSFSATSPSSSPAQGQTGSNHPTLLPVTTATQAAAFKNQYATWSSGGGTNWDRGLAAAANSGVHYDLVVLITDGNPTVFGTTPSSTASAFNSFQDIDAGIFSANQLKAAGSRVVAFGVGPAITTASALNLRAISGTTTSSDYFLADDFAAAAAQLAALARANCQGSIEVQKMIVPAGGTIAEATPAPAGWEFVASTTATGVAVAPGTATTTATSGGKVTYGLSFTNPATSGPVQILETQQAGYELLPVGTGAAARNAVCVNSSTGSPVPVPVTDAGTAANPGFSVVGRAEAQISCTLYNRVVLPPAQNPGFTLTKTSNPVAGSTVRGGDTLTYTVTGTNTGDTPLNPVTLTDDLTGVLDHAVLTGTPTASTGSAPILTGTTLTWTGPLPVGGNVVLTYTVTIDDDVEAGTVVHNRVEGSAQPPTTPENPVPPITPPPVETHHPVPGFTLTKTSDPTPGTIVAGGRSITYTVTGTNTGATVLDPVTLTDDLTRVLDNATLTGTPTSTVGAAPTVTGTTLTWTGSLPVGGSVVLSYTVTIDDGVEAGTVVHNRVEGSAQPPTTPENPVPPITPPPVETEHPTPGAPGFTLTKTSDPVPGSTVVAGDEITYTVTGTNTGATVLDPVTLTDTLDQVLNNASLVGTPTASTGSAPILTGTTLTWTGSLPVGGSVVLTYTVTIDDDVEAGTVVHNRVEGSAQPPTTPENPVPPITPPPVETQHPVPGFTLTKTSNPPSGTPVAAGDTITYTVTGTNTGATVLAPVTLTDDLTRVLDHATLTGTPTSSVGAAPTVTGNTLSWNGSLPIDGSVALTYTVTIDDDVEAGTVVHNHVEGSAQPPTTPEHPVPPITPPPVETEHPVPGTPGFTLTKTSDPVPGSTVVAGDEITYTVTGTNTGSTVLDPVTLTDTLAEVLDNATLTGTPAASAGSAPVLTGSTLTWTGALPVGGVVTLTYTVRIDDTVPAGTLVRNHVEGSAQPPTTPSNPVPPITPPPVETQHPVPGFTLTKTSDPVSGSAVVGGDTITYTVTGTNTGATVLDPVTLTDDLTRVLDNATLVGAPSSSTGAAPALDGTTLTWTGSLPVGGSVALTYTVRIDDPVPAGTVVHNRVEGSAQPPTTPEPPITPPPVETEHPVPGLAVAKSSDPATGTAVAPGQDIVYTLTFDNAGAAPVTVDHVDDLSGVLDDADVTVDPALATGDGLTVGAVVDGRFTVAGTLAVGATATVTYTVKVRAGDRWGDKLLLNYLFANGTTPPGTCESTDPLCTEHPVEVPRVAYQGWKTSDPAPGTKVGTGQRIVYTLTVQNTGTAPAPVKLVDNMADALDDATFNDDLVVTGSSVAVVRDGDRLTWNGEVAVGGTVSITYSVTVKAWAEQGNHHLLNLLTFPDEIGTCSPRGCVVEHPIETPAADGGVAGRTGGTINSGFGTLGDGPNRLLVGGGLGLLVLVGLGLITVRRHRDEPAGSAVTRA